MPTNNVVMWPLTSPVASWTRLHHVAELLHGRNGERITSAAYEAVRGAPMMRTGVAQVGFSPV
jgi:hypothetical protein